MYLLPNHYPTLSMNCLPLALVIVYTTAETCRMNVHETIQVSIIVEERREARSMSSNIHKFLLTPESHFPPMMVTGPPVVGTFTDPPPPCLSCATVTCGPRKSGLSYTDWTTSFGLTCSTALPPPPLTVTGPLLVGTFTDTPPPCLSCATPPKTQQINNQRSDATL